MGVRQQYEQLPTRLRVHDLINCDARPGFLTPKRMHRFKPVKVIGKGTYGEAILVRQRSDDKPFVVKKVPLAGLPAKERSEAANEVAVLDALRHPHIVAYHRAFEEAESWHSQPSPRSRATTSCTHPYRRADRGGKA